MERNPNCREVFNTPCKKSPASIGGGMNCTKLLYILW